MSPSKQKPKANQGISPKVESMEHGRRFRGRVEALNEIRDFLASNQGEIQLLHYAAHGGRGKPHFLGEVLDIEDLYRKLETARLSDVQEFYTLLIGDSTTDAPPPKKKKKGKGR